MIYYSYEIKGVSGYAYQDGRDFFVKKGSEAVGNNKLSSSFKSRDENQSRRRIRRKLINEGKLKGDDEVLKFAEDIKFSSISNAATIIAGNSYNGIIFKSTLQPRLYNIVKQDLDSIAIEETDFEGSLQKRFINYYERKPKLRAKAIEIHGTKCMVSACGFDFENIYGDHGKNYIEVHHIKPISTSRGQIEINPENDMVVVCSNCHRMIHRKKDKILSIKQVSTLIRQNKQI